LIENLAAFLVVDRHWLERSDKRNQPEYINEAFQRLILAFILEHCSKEFMNHPVDSKLRVVEPVPQSERRSTTALQARNTEENKKRPSPQPLIVGSNSKRLRLDPDDAEVGCSMCNLCLLMLRFQDSDLIDDEDSEMAEDEEDEFCEEVV
jgi:hypothetical protein